MSDPLNDRVTALENWRITQENWRMAKEKLDEARHDANISQFTFLKNGQSDTTRHLIIQDGKLDKIAEITTDIRLKLSENDGAQKAIDKSEKDELAAVNAKTAIKANWIAAAGILLGPLIGAIITVWFLHK